MSDSDNEMVYPAARSFKTYQVLESELNMLAWPFAWFLRRRIVKRIKAESSTLGDAER